MALFDRIYARGLSMPSKDAVVRVKSSPVKTPKGIRSTKRSVTTSDDRSKRGITKESPTGCTFQSSPETVRMGIKKRFPKEFFPKDYRLAIDIEKSSLSSTSDKKLKKKRMKKASPSYPLSGNSCAGTTFPITKRSVIHRSPSTLSEKSSKNIKLSLKNKSTALYSPGTNPKRKKKKTRKSPLSSSSGGRISPSLLKFVSPPKEAPTMVFLGNNRMKLKPYAPVLKKDRKSKKQPSEMQKPSLKLDQKPQSPSPKEKPDKNPRRNKKRTLAIAKSGPLTVKGFHGSKIVQIKELPEYPYSPYDSSDLNSDLMLSLSPSDCSSSENGSPGVYRMTRQRSQDFHVSKFKSSPDSCISVKVPLSLTDSTSDELRYRRKLLNLMHESYLRSSSSAASLPEHEEAVEGETPTNKRDPIAQKTTPQKENPLKQSIKAWAWTYEEWLAHKRRQRREQLQRQKEERAVRDYHLEQRREISQIVYQMWLKKKQREEDEQRYQNHMQMAALTVSYALKKNPIAAPTAMAKPIRHRSQDQIKEELESWSQKKTRMQMAKRQEEELAKMKHQEVEFNRRRKSEMAIKKWFSTVHKKPKPVPLNQGFDSLRGSVSKMYVNPQPWVD